MYTIKDVATKMDISEHTLRFWAKCDFFPFLQRNKNNVRIFHEDDLKWVNLVKCLRNIGVENKIIKKYIDLCLVGDSTIVERYEIIKSTRLKAKKQMEELKNQFLLIDEKEKFYLNLIANKAKDKCNPVFV